MFPLRMTGCAVRRRGKRVLGPVDLTIDQGGPTMVIGPNGSGKTTLLRVMHGIERISDGASAWTEDQPEGRAFVFQSPTLLRRSVIDNLIYPLQLARVPKAEAYKRADHWLERIALTDHRNASARRLSAGERQKLAMARAMIQAPEVLFLDEPCANLDGHATREIEALLQDSAAAGTNVIMATHDIGQARRLARNVVFMVNGKVHEHSAAAKALSSPQTPELAAFLRGDIVT